MNNRDTSNSFQPSPKKVYSRKSQRNLAVNVTEVSNSGNSSNLLASDPQLVSQLHKMILEEVSDLYS